ncbi:MAG: GIY-YIG nuclease family protein [Thiolinea sp.]
MYPKKKMNRIEKLKQLYSSTKLSEILHIRKEDDYPDRGFSSLRFRRNDYRLRAIEIWDQSDGQFFRIYHSPRMATEIKTEINDIEGLIKSLGYLSDFASDFTLICESLFNILSGDIVVALAKSNPVYTRNSAYEGLALPDVDISDTDIMGRLFDWKEVIAISEDDSPGNELKKTLSQCGVYLQRSDDGKSRYVGSAYSEGGILSRWLKHLNSNGDAKHLNLFVLENGYANIVFTVLEFTSKEGALTSESRWKATLGTKNSGPYDSLRLNSN